MSSHVLDPENRILYLEDGSLYRLDDLNAINFLNGMNYLGESLARIGIMADGKKTQSEFMMDVDSQIRLIQDMDRVSGFCRVQMNKYPDWEEVFTYGKVIWKIVNLDRVTAVWDTANRHYCQVIMGSFITEIPGTERDGFLRIWKARKAWKEEHDDDDGSGVVGKPDIPGQ